MTKSKPMLQKLLALDLQNLTKEEINWLHQLKNLAAALTGRLQLKHMKQTIKAKHIFGKTK